MYIVRIVVDHLKSGNHDEACETSEGKIHPTAIHFPHFPSNLSSFPLLLLKAAGTSGYMIPVICDINDM